MPWIAFALTRGTEAPGPIDIHGYGVGVAHLDCGRRPEFANQFRNWSFDVDIDKSAAEYGIPTNLDGWTKVEFENPVKPN